MILVSVLNVKVLYMCFSAKFFIFICMFFLTSCASNLKYINVNKLNEVEKGKTLQIAYGNYDVYGKTWSNDISPDIKEYYYNVFEKYGFVKFKEKNKNDLPDYVAIADGKCHMFNGVDVVPIIGRTGINSITTNYNSNTYGRLNTHSNASYYNGTIYGTSTSTYNGTTYGTATSTVNYDYGVVGYNNIPYQIQDKNMTFMIVRMDKQTKKLSSDIVYRSSLDLKVRNEYGCDLENDLKNLSVSDKKFSDKINKTSVDCYKNSNGKRICNPDNGMFSNLWNRIFNSELYE